MMTAAETHGITGSTCLKSPPRSRTLPPNGTPVNCMESMGRIIDASSMCDLVGFEHASKLMVCCMSLLQ